MNKESKPVAAEAETLPCTHPFLEALAELATWCFLTFGVVACLLFWMGMIDWSPLDAIDAINRPSVESFISLEQVAAALDLVRPFIGGLVWLFCGGLPALAAALFLRKIAQG
ncbi:hypothetical protein [Pseudomonas aeruginosa]|uniref:hypothetical protein n=2 Tax=Pseudomonas aeruginosa TaxID=287 RepID=UPI0006279911|nr:hypothetical protein [Pseudomonas aeruginosa]KKJ55130.1 hypothetical protein T648_03880 [Pseudomonas aeruginosa MRSN 317]RTT50406.1 hypothetical protein DY962_29655 [Pseudomonas aeruginosa]